MTRVRGWGWVLQLGLALGSAMQAYGLRTQWLFSQNVLQDSQLQDCAATRAPPRIPQRLSPTIKDVTECLSPSTGQLVDGCDPVPTVLRRNLAGEVTGQQRRDVFELLAESNSHMLCDTPDGRRELNFSAFVSEASWQESAVRCWTSHDFSVTYEMQLADQKRSPIRPFADSIFVGGGACQAMLHVDTAFTSQYHVMVAGRKRWTVFLPSQFPLLWISPLSTRSSIPLDFMDDWCAVNERWPALSLAYYYQFDVAEGDIVYLPPGTAHAVEYLGEPGVGFNRVSNAIERKSSWGSFWGVWDALRNREFIYDLRERVNHLISRREMLLHSLKENAQGHPPARTWTWTAFMASCIDFCTDSSFWFVDGLGRWLPLSSPAAVGSGLWLHHAIRGLYALACRPFIYAM